MKIDIAKKGSMALVDVYLTRDDLRVQATLRYALQIMDNPLSICKDDEKIYTPMFQGYVHFCVCGECSVFETSYSDEEKNDSLNDRLTHAELDKISEQIYSALNMPSMVN